MVPSAQHDIKYFSYCDQLCFGLCLWNFSFTSFLIFFFSNDLVYYCLAFFSSSYYLLSPAFHQKVFQSLTVLLLIFLHSAQLLSSHFFSFPTFLDLGCWLPVCLDLYHIICINMWKHISWSWPQNFSIPSPLLLKNTAWKHNNPNLTMCKCMCVQEQFQCISSAVQKWNYINFKSQE